MGNLGGFVILLFLPIVILFQIFLGFIITSVWKIKVIENDSVKKYLTFWLYGLVGSIVVGGAVMLMMTVFQKLMVFLFR
ncbi:hypothetical protein [Chryseobacterium sp. Leaf394]|uniref:hypothetical protein n=1 Tax=Chryseobacterium sp. Leaf394 TaxID=1736361 RepID=UPI0006FB6538|nr:hypothetical protein [Chryseobacterium sp. Leaf394]KQS90080.1 hypothetical protein ASG21_14035 [Chryseobacterium sp. Leaf394]